MKLTTATKRYVNSVHRPSRAKAPPPINPAIAVDSCNIETSWDGAWWTVRWWWSKDAVTRYC
ncbi:hypothetical protein ACFQ9X_28135 [Catenulispora yoronensis]